MSTTVSEAVPKLEEIKITIPDPEQYTDAQKEERRQITAAALPQIYNAVKSQLTAKFTTDLADAAESLNTKMQEQLKTEIDKWKASLTPPSQEDLQKLLSQEYLEFSIKVRTADGKERAFTIRELPQAVEKKFWRQLESTLVPRLKDLQGLKMILSEGEIEQKINNILNLFGKSFDIMAQTVALVLNPFNEEPDVTTEWVQDNISNSRQMNIIQAQVHVNRLRDFFSQVFQIIK